MDKCKICGKNGEMKVDNRYTYCIQHYVENEDDECLYWNLNRIMQEAKEGKLKESTKKLLAEINKKCPNHLKRYKEDNQDTNSN